MTNKKQLIDASDVYLLFDMTGFATMRVSDIDTIQRVDAVEVPHPEVRNAVILLQKQYEKALNLPHVRDPLAWAFYHTWKMLDSGRRKDGDENDKTKS